jgi:hypothetical protein
VVPTKDEQRGAFSRFSAGQYNEFVLGITPRLESWDAKHARSQAALQEYLDHVESLVASSLAELPRPWALDLSVGIANDVSLTSGGRDLDNYLYPVVRRLGWDHFCLVSARKHHGTTSLLRIATVSQIHKAGGLNDSSFAHALTSVSSATMAWKRELKEQIERQVVSPVTAEPLEMEICFRLAQRRNWAYLWKPTLDALGPILGVDNPLKPYHARDDRIVRLTMHRETDASMGNRVGIAIWWRSPTPDSASEAL